MNFSRHVWHPTKVNWFSRTPSAIHDRVWLSFFLLKNRFFQNHAPAVLINEHPTVKTIDLHLPICAHISSLRKQTTSKEEIRSGLDESKTEEVLILGENCSELTRETNELDFRCESSRSWHGESLEESRVLCAAASHLAFLLKNQLRTMSK